MLGAVEIDWKIFSGVVLLKRGGVFFCSLILFMSETVSAPDNSARISLPSICRVTFGGLFPPVGRSPNHDSCSAVSDSRSSGALFLSDNAPIMMVEHMTSTPMPICTKHTPVSAKLCKHTVATDRSGFVLRNTGKSTRKEKKPTNVRRVSSSPCSLRQLACSPFNNLAYGRMEERGGITDGLKPLKT